jgi:DNA polymerase-3 subunit delta'
LLFSQTTAPAAVPTLLQRLQQGNHPDLLWVAPTYQHQGKLLTVAEAEAQGVTRRSAPVIRLEQIRQITQFLSRPPLEADRAVVVLENAETMAEAAANALLKTLEEPGRASLILIAPGIESILPTLVSRCQRIPFYRLAQTDMARVLEQSGHNELLHHPDILAMAQGSPGEAITTFRYHQSIPADLLQSITRPPPSLRVALDLARQIAKTLDADQQLWLISYLQYHYWHQCDRADHFQPNWLYLLETARKSLLAYAQPRLVWEVTLMAMV